MNRIPYFIDIETIPGQHPSIMNALQADAAIQKASIKAPGNYKDADKINAYIEEKMAEIDASIEERHRKTSFDGAYGQIVSASIAIGDGEPINLYGNDWKSAEPKILTDLFSIIDHSHNSTQGRAPVFVGHNVVGFDLRFIFHRAILLGIKPPSIIPFNAKPWSEDVYDTMTQWAGAGKMVSLDKLCRILGVATKGTEIGDEIDGSKVYDFVLAGRIADVATYCGGDVDRCREVYRRMNFLKAPVLSNVEF